MQTDPKTCDAGLIHRYFDQDLSKGSTEKIEAHLRDCAACRKVLEEIEAVSSRFKAHIAGHASGIQDRELEDSVLSGIHKKATPWWITLKRALFSKKFYIPASATAALAIILFMIIPAPGINGPTAIVNSISGDVASIVILETPKTRQTIVWFEEYPEGPGS